jgi:hypothetical protein
MRIGSIVFTALAIFGAGCQQEAANPYGTAYPGMSVGPGGVMMPGMSVSPNGAVQMPGISVGPNGAVQMPGISVGPNGAVQMPGFGLPPGMPVAVAGAVPASFGVPECDAYAARACSCANATVRGAMCQAAATSFQAWSAAVAATPMARDGIVQGCTSAAASLAAACGG